MSKDKVSRDIMLRNILQELLESNSEIKGAMIVSPDGLSLANELTTVNSPSDVVGAMTAAGVGLAKRVTEALDCGQFHAIVVEGSDMFLRIYAAGNHATLCVLSKSNANVGLINLDAKEVAQKISQVL